MATLAATGAAYSMQYHEVIKHTGIKYILHYTAFVLVLFLTPLWLLGTAGIAGCSGFLLTVELAFAGLVGCVVSRSFYIHLVHKGLVEARNLMYLSSSKRYMKQFFYMYVLALCGGVLTLAWLITAPQSGQVVEGYGANRGWQCAPLTGQVALWSDMPISVSRTLYFVGLSLVMLFNVVFVVGLGLVSIYMITRIPSTYREKETILLWLGSACFLALLLPLLLLLGILRYKHVSILVLALFVYVEAWLSLLCLVAGKVAFVLLEPWFPMVQETSHLSNSYATSSVSLPPGAYNVKDEIAKQRYPTPTADLPMYQRTPIVDAKTQRPYNHPLLPEEWSPRVSESSDDARTDPALYIHRAAATVPVPRTLCKCFVLASVAIV